MDVLIAAEIKKLETLQLLKKGVMIALFPTEDKNVPEMRFPEFKNYDNWVEIPLHEIGDIVTGISPSIYETDNYGGDHLFVLPSDLSESRFIMETEYKLTNKGFSFSNKIPKNSILVVCNGLAIGKVAQNFYECATNKQINALIPSNSWVADFIYYALKLYFPRITQRPMKVSVPTITNNQFSSIKVKIPLRKAEQHKIACCLSSLDDKITLQIDKVNALKLYQKGLEAVFVNLSNSDHFLSNDQNV